MMIDKGIQDAERPAAAGTEGGRRPTGVLPAPQNFSLVIAHPVSSRHSWGTAAFDCFADSSR